MSPAPFSDAVKTKVLLQQNRQCDCCGRPISPYDPDGLPCEYHHRRKNGTADIRNAVALCPACHAKIHEYAEKYPARGYKFHKHCLVVSSAKLLRDSDRCLIYEREEPSPSDKKLRCRCRFEYREIENGDRPVTKQQLMAELKKLKHEIENCRLLTILSPIGFTKAAMFYFWISDDYPNVRISMGDLDSVRRSYMDGAETTGEKQKNESSNDH